MKEETILNFKDYHNLISSCWDYISYYVNRICEYLKENNYKQLYLYHIKKGKILCSKEDITDSLDISFAKNFTKEISQNKDIELCINKINQLITFLDHLEIETLYQNGELRQKHVDIYSQYFSIKNDRKQKFIKMHFFSKTNSKYAIKVYDSQKRMFYTIFNRLIINQEQYIAIKDHKNYTFKNLITLLEDQQKKKIFLHNTDFLFDRNNCIAPPYKNRSLKDHDLSKIDFDNKNISGLDISKNPEVHINFDKIRKDVSDCNFSGYDLSKVTFRNFNIQNTDFRNTSATIDLATCPISKEGKMNPGTLFDKENKFFFYDKKLTINQVQDLGIKIYQKEK